MPLPRIRSDQFSLYRTFRKTRKEAKRRRRLLSQRVALGFDRSELWNLDTTTLKYYKLVGPALSIPADVLSKLNLLLDEYHDDSYPQSDYDAINSMFILRAMDDHEFASHFSNFMVSRLTEFALTTCGHPQDYTFEAWKAEILGMAREFALLPTYDGQKMSEHEKLEKLSLFQPFIKEFRHIWD